MIKVLIVDDEPLARENLRVFLQELPDLLCPVKTIIKRQVDIHKDQICLPLCIFPIHGLKLFQIFRFKAPFPAESHNFFRQDQIVFYK